MKDSVTITVDHNPVLRRPKSQSVHTFDLGLFYCTSINNKKSILMVHFLIVIETYPNKSSNALSG